MKHLTIILLSGVIALSGCSKEPPSYASYNYPKDGVSLIINIESKEDAFRLSELVSHAPRPCGMRVIDAKRPNRYYVYWEGFQK